MSRLTNQQYLDRHYFLFKLWHEGAQDFFAVLSTNAQVDLHRFYSASLPLSDELLIAHRKRVSQVSLPQRTGRSFAAVRGAYIDATHAAEIAPDDPAAMRNALRPHLHGKPYVPASGKHRIRVVGIARPEPDLRRIARALVQQAQQELLEQQNRRAA